MPLQFHCLECSKEISNAQDAISFFDNQLCVSCEVTMFKKMAEDGRSLKATSPDTVSRFGHVNGFWCDKCHDFVSGRVIELEADDIAISFCQRHLAEFYAKTKR